jgi:hypothetical protein
MYVNAIRFVFAKRIQAAINVGTIAYPYEVPCAKRCAIEHFLDGFIAAQPKYSVSQPGAVS